MDERKPIAVGDAKMSVVMAWAGEKNQTSTKYDGEMRASDQLLEQTPAFARLPSKHILSLTCTDGWLASFSFM